MMSLDMTGFLRDIALLTVPILIAVTFHELSHGLVAYKLGDPTAKMMGRLTFNPIKHLDLIGSLVFIITKTIGWAKPVPVNPFNFRNPRRDMVWVSIAGPLANFIIAIVASIIYGFVLHLSVGPLTEKIFVPLALMLRYTVVLNIGIGVFNLLPVPPLDGSKILMGILPENLAYHYSRIEPFGFIILILLIIFRVVDILIFPIINLLVKVLIP